jgi:hypothetical protein
MLFALVADPHFQEIPREDVSLQQEFVVFLEVIE